LDKKREINVSQLIDQAKLSRFQVSIISLCALIAVIDGFDTQSIAFVAPVIAKEWGISGTAFGAVFGIGLFGLMAGSMLLGPLADRFGRKKMIILSLLFMGIFSLLTASAETITQLVIYRFLTGVGLGGAMPNIIAMTAEYSPQRIRNTMTTIMYTGFPLGAVFGGFVSAHMIPIWGWEWVFYLGGALPLLLIPVLLILFPESIRFLVNKGDQSQQVMRILNKINPAVPCQKDDVYYLPEVKVTGFSVKHLFKNGLAQNTLLLWVIYFTILLILYSLINWLPSILREAGFPIEKAIIATALFNLGGMIGGITIGRLIDKISYRNIITPSFAIGSVVVGAIGFLGSSVPLIMVMVFLSGMFVMGGIFSVQSLGASFYPTAIRTTGIGWALGIGRIGSIIGPVLGGIMLSAELALTEIFLLCGAPAIVAAIAVWFFKNPNSVVEGNKESSNESITQHAG
jgi:AAHS family 4-hydroxybenzoate transporter-like MFS transporter